MRKVLPEAIAKRFQDAYFKTGLQASEVYKLCGVGKKTVYDVCINGTSCTFITAIKLAKCFGVSLDWLVNGDEVK